MHRAKHKLAGARLETVTMTFTAMEDQWQLSGKRTGKSESVLRTSYIIVHVVRVNLKELPMYKLTLVQILYLERKSLHDQEDADNSLVVY